MMTQTPNNLILRQAANLVASGCQDVKLQALPEGEWRCNFHDDDGGGHVIIFRPNGLIKETRRAS